MEVAYQLEKRTGLVMMVLQTAALVVMVVQVAVLVVTLLEEELATQAVIRLIQTINIL